MSGLVIKDLTKRFGSYTAVHPLNLTIRAGKCTALLGPNGAGKTTTLHMLTGLLKPTGGSIALRSSTGEIVKGDLREHLGFLPQAPSFNDWMTGREWLCLMGQLSGQSSKEASIQADMWLEITGLKQAARRRIGGYSGGMRQRLGLAQAMIHSPSLLLLDEPVSALDPIGRREVMSLLQSMKGELTLLFSTHVLHEVEELCDDLVLMKDGRVVEQGEWSRLRNAKRSSVLTIEVDPFPEAAAWLSSLRNLPSINSVEITGFTAILHAEDIDKARQALLKEMESKRVPVLRFDAGMRSLEQLFMEVVNA